MLIGLQFPCSKEGRYRNKGVSGTVNIVPFTAFPLFALLFFRRLWLQVNFNLTLSLDEELTTLCRFPLHRGAGPYV